MLSEKGKAREGVMRRRFALPLVPTIQSSTTLVPTIQSST